MTETDPFFSVIVPAYNARAFLAETLGSIRDQSFASLECIVVDDGSTDETPDIAAAFAVDPRFSLLRIEHGGSPGRARNHGIRRARAEWVAFLDADDLWTLNKLQRYHDHIAATGADVVFSNGYAVDDRGRVISRLLSPRMRARFHTGDPSLVITNVVPVPSAAMRTPLALRYPFAEDPDIRGAEDYLLWLTVNEHHALDYLNESLLLYRCHAEQMHRDPLEQLRKWDKILDEGDIGRTHGDQVVALTRQLIDVRRRYYGGGKVPALLAALRCTPWLMTPQRPILLQYLRFGLMLRVNTMLRQRVKGVHVGV